MNIVEAMRVLRNKDAAGLAAFIEAASIFDDLVAAHDALAPKPEDWPEGMKWYTIDASGQGRWSINEPHVELLYGDTTYWFVEMSWLEKGIKPLRIGIDWRGCKWERKEGN